MQNEKTIRKLLRQANKHGATWFVVKDTEEVVIRSNNVNDIITAMDGGDEEFLIDCYSGEKGLKAYIGWFGLVMDNDEEECISDYSDNDFCNEVMEDF